MKLLPAQKICAKYGENPADGLVDDTRCWTEWTDESTTTTTAAAATTTTQLLCIAGWT